MRLDCPRPGAAVPVRGRARIGRPASGGGRAGQGLVCPLTRSGDAGMKLGAAALAAYIGMIVAANALTARYGFIAVAPGLAATAGTYAAGLAFVFRNLTQEAFGRWLVLAAIAAGAALSWWLASPALAVASGVTFIISETADWAAYTSLRARGWVRAAAVGNVCGFVVDTFLFL